jgi:hypothetical protein
MDRANVELPSIVSFSGGRTSAMMLLKLLEQGKLQQWRGDCVVFNNTSAEHAATYGFVSRLKQITEQQYNIPFFMLEFCTYEAKTSRGFVRRMTYKLVNDVPYCKHNNSNGYKFKGEVFEESISQSGVLPSNFQRNCTINMKILVTNYFLADWLASKPHIDQQGTHSKTSNISDADVVKKHRMYHGELSDEAIIDKKTFVRACQTFRAKQSFKDYTKADVDYNNAYLKAKIINNKAKTANSKDKTDNNKKTANSKDKTDNNKKTANSKDKIASNKNNTTNNKDKATNSKAKTTNNCISLFGKDAVQYHNYIGIRFDEKHRAIKIRNRIKQAKLNLNRKNKKGGSIKTQPPFEHVKMPMIKANINKANVIEFWKDPIRSKYDLDLPFDGLLSNCVHCMLKGKSKNQLIAKNTLELELGHGHVDVSTSTLSSPNLPTLSTSPSSSTLLTSLTSPSPSTSLTSPTSPSPSTSLTSSTSPSSLAWWIAIERKYSRKVIKSNDNNYTNIGFFGASKDYVYQTWANELTGNNNTEALVKSAEQDSWSMDCNCTD